MAMLRARFFDDSDGTGKLTVHAEANGFSGEGGAYFGIEQIKAFAASLGAFPLIGRPSMAGGFYSKTRTAELDQVHVALAAYPIGATGKLGIHVRLSTELWEPSRQESQHSVALEISTEYEPLARFARELTGLVSGTLDEAVLRSPSEVAGRPAREDQT